MSSDDEIRKAMVTALGVSAMPRDWLIEKIVAAGLVGSAAGNERVATILQFDTRFSEVSGGVIYVPALLDGSTWTIRVDAEDATDDFVRVNPQLSPLAWWLVSSDVNLIDGDGGVLGQLTTGSLWIDATDTDVLYGPAGWLDEIAGGVAQVAVLGGNLCFAPITSPPSATARQITAVKAGFERAAEARDATLFDAEHIGLEYAVGDRPVYEALLIDRDAFVSDPVPLLPDFYTAAGLEQRDGIVAAAGFDWDALHSWQHRNRARHFYRLDERQVDFFMLLVGACDLYAESGEESLGPDEGERDRGAVLLSALLEDGEVASAFWTDMQLRGRTVDEIGAFADELAGRMDGVALAGLAWVRACWREEQGDARGAFEVLEAAVGSDCTHGPALTALAGYASDRGDAATAWRLLRQTGALDEDASANADEDSIVDDDDELLDLIDEVAPFAMHRPRPLVGRNDPCPCGSGRKYKACHLGREQHPLAERASWLYRKATRFMRRFDSATLDDLASDMTADVPWHRDEMQSSPFATDLVLHECGVLEEFLAERGWLLPDDEAMLAAQWALVDRGVFEITGIHNNAVDLRDIGRGEDIRVVSVTADESTRVGAIVVGRPLPINDTHRAFSGFLPLPPHLVNPMLDAIGEGGPDAIIDLIALMLRPPDLQNTDGEELVLHTIRWSVPSEADLDAVLGTNGFRRVDDHTWHLSTDTINQADTIVYVLRFDPDVGTLTGDVNSDERATRLIELVADLVPASQLLEDDQRSIDEMRDEYEGSDSPRPRTPEDPAVAQALAEFLAMKEREWVDESIPALGGRTPRDAVTDPIGREEVRRLLASFPEPPSGQVGMRPSRLRSLLDLEE